MRAPRLQVTAHAPHLDVDDAPRVKLQTFAGVFGRVDGLIQTEWCGELALKLRVVEEVVMGQRLLDVVQAEFVELLENPRVGQRVGAVGVYGEGHVGQGVSARRVAGRRPNRV